MVGETIQCLFSHTSTFDCLKEIAHNPHWIYVFLVVMMLLSAVGLPFPEEVTLVSVGVLAYIGQHPELYPLQDGQTAVNPINPTTAAIVAFFAVFLSDLLIYSIGRLFGPRVFQWAPVKRFISEENRMKIEKWTHKYGSLACGIFRFTPGIRFPGHLACGMVKFSVWKFMLIDGLAALISVPTQVLLFAHYGDTIYGTFSKFKYFIFGILAIALLIYLYKKWTSHKKVQRS